MGRVLLIDEAGSQPTCQPLLLLLAYIDENQPGLTGRGSSQAHERGSATKQPECMRNIPDGSHHLRSPRATFEEYVAPFR